MYSAQCERDREIDVVRVYEGKSDTISNLWAAFESKLLGLSCKDTPVSWSGG